MEKLSLSMIDRIRIFDENEKKFRIAYMLDGRPCHIYEMKTKLARQAAGIQSIVSDLEIIERSLAHAIELRKDLIDEKFDKNNPLHLVLSSLTTSCIITYGRCFASYTSSARAAQPREQQLKHYVGDIAYKIHKTILELRNTYAAHAGTNTREENKALLLFDPDLKMIPRDVYTAQFSPHFTNEELDKFQALTVLVLKFMKEHQHEIFKIIWEKEINNLDFDSIISKSTTSVELKLKHF